MKKITKKQAEELCFKADNEGLAYAIQEGYLDCPGTALDKKIQAAKKLLNEISDELAVLKERFGLEDA